LRRDVFAAVPQNTRHPKKLVEKSVHAPDETFVE
jgi:hypothetical protein